MNRPDWRDWRDAWSLASGLTYLNHGAFGGCPRVVLSHQDALRRELERNPYDFFVRQLEPRWNAARARMAAFVGTSAENLAFVANASAGVNTILRSLDFGPDDEILTTNFDYLGTRGALEDRARRTSARLVEARIPFPIDGPDAAIDAVMAKVTKGTRLVVVDHVSSVTALVLPIRDLIERLSAQGIDVLVDGAHAPGMIPIDLEALAPTYYVGNIHKWLCCPRSAAMLYVREDRQGRIRPLTAWSKFGRPTLGRSQFHTDFDWQGTRDPTPVLCIPTALDFFASALEDQDGKEGGIRSRNHDLVCWARQTVAEALATELPAPASMLGSMATCLLPARGDKDAAEQIEQALWTQHAIEVPVNPSPTSDQLTIRLSAQLYNRPEDYERLIAALPGVLEGQRGPE